MYEACLQLLCHLHSLSPTSADRPVLDVFHALACFTCAEDPWTSRASYELANRLLDSYMKPLLDEPKRLEALLNGFLKDKAKPLFAKTRNPAVTAAGRKAISPLPAPIEHSIDETDIKPWKYQDIYAVTAFEWVLKQLDV